MKQRLLQVGLIFVLCGLSLPLIGCKKAPEQAYAPQKAGNDIDGNIVMITLEDGTRCAVYTAFYKGGISCDWK